jgi:Tfp pilus assembly protein PilN
MNAVNLLPNKHRPRQATGGGQGSSFVLLGVLGAIVIAVLVYVMSVNSLNQAKSDISEAQAQAAQANAQADALGAYGNFAKVKQERVADVKKLAENRTDWERVVRELAHVLPNGVWMTKAEASDSAADAAATTPNSSTTASGASVILNGCAFSQPDVARTIVRLRELDGATDVTLDHATRPEVQSSSSASGDAGSTGCGAHAGQPNVEFQVNVALAPEHGTPYTPGKVAASLGGGQ